MSVTVTAEKKPQAQSTPDLQQLNKMIARFAPTKVVVDINGLSQGDRTALAKLIEASRVLNDIFMDQLWSGDRALFQKLQQDTSALGRARLHYFWINKGPWSDLDAHKAFLPGVPPKKPAGANFYPEDMSREEFESWLKTLSDKDQESAKGFFTVIRRGSDRKLTIVPYSEAYRDDLQRAAALLKDAANATDNDTLKRFLNARADAFLSNDYYESDLAWMDLDAPLDVTIGPYETYNDELFGYKAAFESYVNLRDEQESAKLASFAHRLQELEDNLPEDAQYRNKKLGAAAPIRVVNEIFSAADGNHGVQTAAYNLPNDERVIQQKGSKRVMLKNVQEEKFRATLVPISKVVIAANEQQDISFDSFFTHILCHELMHGLGPHQISAGGRSTSPRETLKELYSAIEEAKADVTGLWALQYLMDHPGDQPIVKGGADAERKLYTTFLASAFRSLRFGITEAHGRGMALQMNYLLDKGGFVANKNGTFAVDMQKIKQAVQDLDHELLTVEATGDYARAKQMLTGLAVIRPEVQRALDRMRDIPVDIEPVFVTADQVNPPKVKTSS